jgi:hypothetical protein
MSNTENPSVESPELELEDEGETDLKVRTNLKAGTLVLNPGVYYQPVATNPLDLVAAKMSGVSGLSTRGNTVSG